MLQLPGFSLALVPGPNNSIARLLSIFQNGGPESEIFARSSASSLVVVGLAAWAVLKSSRATALDGTAVDVVALAFFKCRSTSRTNQTTGHVTTKLAAATKEKICDRFIMSLPFGDRDISGYRGVAMLQK